MPAGVSDGGGAGVLPGPRGGGGWEVSRVCEGENRGSVMRRGGDGERGGVVREDWAEARGFHAGGEEGGPAGARDRAGRFVTRPAAPAGAGRLRGRGAEDGGAGDPAGDVC